LDCLDDAEAVDHRMHRWVGKEVEQGLRIGRDEPAAETKKRELADICPTLLVIVASATQRSVSSHPKLR
jgi:hypothetical protein